MRQYSISELPETGIPHHKWSDLTLGQCIYFSCEDEEWQRNSTVMWSSSGCDVFSAEVPTSS